MQRLTHNGFLRECSMLAAIFRTQFLCVRRAEDRVAATVEPHIRSGRDGLETFGASVQRRTLFRDFSVCFMLEGMIST